MRPHGKPKLATVSEQLSSRWVVKLENFYGESLLQAIKLGWSGPREFGGGNDSVIERDGAWVERRLSAVMVEQWLRRAPASTSGGK
jgi:hypothetical protein